MFGVDDLVGGFVGGSAWGLGLAAGIAVATVGGKRARPLAKRTIRGYLTATRRMREMSAEAGEQLQDLYAEAKHEYESHGAGTPEGAATGGARRRGQPTEQTG